MTGFLCSPLLLFVGLVTPIRTEPPANVRAAATAYERGHSHIAKAEYDAAVQEFDDAIRLNPQHPCHYCARGFCYAKLGKRDRAIQDYDAAIKLDPNDPEPFACRGRLLALNSEFQLAIKDLTAAIRLNPKDAWVLSIRGSCLANLGEWANALADYTAALELDSEAVFALKNRALLLAAAPDDTLRDGAKALKDAERAYKLTTGKDESCWRILAAVHAEIGQFDEAIKWQGQYMEREVLTATGVEKAKTQLKLYEQKKPYRLGGK